MSEKTYKLKKFTDKSSYEDFATELLELRITDLKYINFSLFETVETKVKYDNISLPENSYNDLVRLLEYFELKSYETEFLSFVSITQENYLNYHTKLDLEIFKDYLSLKKDYNILIKILESYLLEEENDSYSISFKYIKNKTDTIKNTFIVDEIYRAIAEYFKINKDNFQIRKEEILSEYGNSFNYAKGEKYVLIKVVQALFDFLKKQKSDISDNLALKFCGVFLHICQIPSNKSSQTVEIGEIENTLELIDHQNLRHYKEFRSESSYFF